MDVRPVLADRLADHRRVAGVGERHGEVDEVPVEAELARRVAEREHLQRLVERRLVERVLLHVHHPLDALVVRVEVCARDRPVLVAVLPAAVAGLLAHEPLLVLAQQHVRVDQRAAAEAARGDRVDVVEAPHVEHAVQARARVPELRLHAQRRAREGVRRKRLAALEQADAVAGLSQAVGGDGSPEAGSDDERVEVLCSGGQRKSAPSNSRRPAWACRRALRSIGGNNNPAHGAGRAFANVRRRAPAAHRGRSRAGAADRRAATARTPQLPENRPTAAPRRGRRSTACRATSTPAPSRTSPTSAR